jgi:PAS domain S-box-containing protein
MKTTIFRRLPARAPVWEIVWGCFFALALSALAAWLSVAARLHLVRTPFVLLYLAVFLTALAGNRWHGLLSCGLTGWCAWSYVLPAAPGRTRGLADVLSVGVYLAFSLGTVVMVGMLKERRAVLREKERQLTDFMENATVGLQWLAADGTVLWANKAQAEFLGYRVDEYTGRNIREFHVFPACADSILRSLAGNERLKNFETRLRTKNGSVRLAMLDADVFWRNGQFVHARCFVRDVTARRQAEQRLQASEQKYRTLIASANDAILLADAETGVVLEANAKAEQLLGLPVREIVGLDQTRLHPPEEAMRYREIFRQAVEAGQTMSGELFVCRPNGTRVPVEISTSVVCFDEQRVLYEVFRDLTERKKTVESLAKKRNLLRTLIDNLPDYIYTKDRQSRFVVSNLANTRLLGATAEEQIRGKSVLDLCAKKVAQRFVEDDQRVIQTGEPLFDREEAFTASDGAERTFLTTKLPLRNLDGEVTGLVGVSKDITERKRADEALRKSEASLRLAQRIGRIGSWEADLRKNTLEWSEETYRIFGCWRDTFQPAEAAFLELVHPADRDVVRKAAEHALKHGKYYSVDYRIMRPDGFERFLVQQARIIRDEAGNATQMLGTVQDITERKLSEEALRASEERFRVLFERSPEPVFILDPHDDERLLPIIDCNEAACRQSGYSREELIGQSLSRMDLGLKDHAQVRPFIQRLRETRTIQVETSHRRADASELCVESSMSLIVLGNRELILCMSRDVSARKKAEEAVRQLTEELEARVEERTRQLAEANRELEAFSYSVSHDLRAPVRAIGGFSQILLEDHQHKLDPEMHRLLGVISNSAGRMGELIEDLLEFSRLNAQAIERRPVQMTTLVRSVIQESLQQRPHAQLAMHLNELPDVEGDESMLRQIFVNLIGNALKFTRRSPEPRIEIGCEVRGEEGVFFVRDNGVGFDMNYVGKLFQVFQRLHLASQFEGTGVGLAIVQRIVQRHGGRVWAEGTPGAGATISFALPLRSLVPA